MRVSPLQRLSRACARQRSPTSLIPSGHQCAPSVATRLSLSRRDKHLLQAQDGGMQASSAAATTAASSPILIGAGSSATVSSLLGSNGTLGFGFSAGGLLYAYYVGVIMALRDELGLLKEDTPVAGASAGAIVAVTAKSGLSESDLIEATLKLARDCRQNGTRFRLRKVLQRTLEEVLPADIHERCSGNTFLAVTQLWPEFKPRLVSEYRSRQHVIETLLTSAHIPWYFDGSLVTGYGSTLAFDGGITNFIPVPPTCDVAVRVTCFARSNLRVFNGIGISPDSFEDWPYDMRQMINWALEPASEEMLESLIAKGKRDARTWATYQGLAAAAAKPAPTPGVVLRP